jgi:DNA repair protein SbcC/Rad50
VPSASKLRLQEVRIEGFRGINKPLTLPIGETTLLFAPNGKGKTSILGGIEWCLFGKLNFQPAENGTNDELVNLSHPRGSARVELVLAANGRSYVVTRERRLRKRETNLSVLASDGQRFEGDEGESFLFRLLGLTWEDFSRAVFLHQESIRGLLTDAPETRDAALDRLFGLEKLRNVSASIPLKVVTDAVQDVQRQAERATGKLEGAAEQIEQLREKHLADAQERGFAEKDLTLERGLTIARRIAAQLSELHKENKLEPPPLEDLNEIEDLEKVSRRAKDTTKQIRIAVARASPAGETTERINELDLLKDRIAGSGELVAETTKLVMDHEAKWGDEQKIEARKKELEAEIGDVEHRLRVLGVQDRLLSGAIEFLRAEPGASACPVCAQPINGPKLAADLERQIKSVQAKEARSLDKKVRESRETLAETEQASKDGAQLRKANQRAVDAQNKALVELRGVLPEAESLEQAGTAIDRASKALHKQLEEQNKFHAKREERLQAVDDEVDDLRALYRFLKSEEKFEAISAKAPDAKEEDPLQKELEVLLALQESLRLIARATNEVAKSRASAAVEESREGISSFYRQLCNHPYFDGIRIETEEKNVRGLTRNTYTIRAVANEDGKETLASSRLSTGQMNCVALSIYLALARVLGHHLGFVILDDPSQNLDREHKVALASILKGLRPGTQLVVASQDDELQEILARELGGKGANTYELAWHPRSGTSLVGGS